MNVVSYDNFIEESWDYVSENVVSDDYWETHQDLILGITFRIYNFYKQNVKNKIYIDIKDYGRMIESLFVEIQKNR